MQRKYIVLLSIVFVIGVVLRFYKLGIVPEGLHRDEAFLGYNAYSILKTGRDMSGRFFPLHFESFLYSPAGYSYFSIPFIGIFGLNAFSVRFASALFGSLTVLMIYFLVRKLFMLSPDSYRLSLIASFLLAISPWHMNLSRTATENTVVVFFIITGITLYVLWVRNGTLGFLLGAFGAFFVTLFIYQAARSFLPLFLPLLMLSTKNQLRHTSSGTSLLLYLVLIILPIIMILRSPELSLRIRTVSLFASGETQLVLDEQGREDGVRGTTPFVTRVFHNKAYGYINQFLKNYSDHFSFPFLFTDLGLPIRYRVPGMGLLYLFELPLLLFGLWKMQQSKHAPFALLVGWLFVTPIGSALSFDDVPNLQRTLIMYPALAIISAYGWIALIDRVTKMKRGKLVSSIAFIIIAAYVLSYLHNYYIHLPIHQTWYRQEGYKKLVQKVNELLPQYQKAMITTRESAPTIFFLFYSSHDPKLFQHYARRNTLRDFDRINFGPYEFSLEECPLRIDAKTGQLTGQSGALYVNYGTCKDPGGIKLLEEIRRGDQSTVFRVVSL